MSQVNDVSDEVTIPLVGRQSLKEKLHAVIENDFTKEAVSIGKIFYPLVIAGCLSYLRSFLTLRFLGRLGPETLAGCSLALAFANMTAYSVFSGLTAGAETICSQAFGAKRYNLFSATIKRGIILLLCTSLPVFILWINIKWILTKLKQDEGLASIARTFMLYSLPDLVAQSFFHPLKAYLRTQSKTLPLSIFTGLVSVLYYPFTSWLKSHLGKNVKIIVLSGVLSNFILVAFLFICINFLKGKISSNGDDDVDDDDEESSLSSWREWKKLVVLASTSCGLVCVEWWCYEIITMICGLLKNFDVSTASMGILIQITSLVYYFPHSLSSAVSTRVGNELGSNRPQGARRSAIVGLVLSIILGILALTFTVSVRNVWATPFTDDENVINLTSTVLPIVGLCELGNCPQTVACGVLKGSARPWIGAVINTVAFYLVGLPVGSALAFRFGYGLMGLWFGMLAAQITSGVGMMVAVYMTDWELEAERARELTSVDAGGDVEDVEAEKLIGEYSGFTEGLPRDEDCSVLHDHLLD